jgi:hypothetical protein
MVAETPTHPDMPVLMLWFDRTLNSAEFRALLERAKREWWERRKAGVADAKRQTSDCR